MTRRLLAVSLVGIALAALWPADAYAQRGRARPQVGRRPVVIAPQRRPTIVYPPWYGPWGYGFPYQYPYPSPYPYRGYYYDDSSNLRIQTTPRETEVYVDGARAGIVDDYDGIFQRLSLTPGEHEITLYLAGFRTWSERRYFAPHSNHRILHTMLQLAPGQPDEPRPVPPPPPPPRDRDDRDVRDDRGDRNRPQPGDRREPRNPPPPDRPEPRNPPPPDRAPLERPVNESRNSGTLSVGIEPGDAEITLDGVKQTLPAGQQRLIIQLQEGVHRLIIKKDGLQTFETDLQIRRGRTLAFNVSLVK
jgi:hypothetical protein